MVTISIVALAAFGPYVGGGIRTEQIAVYALATVALIVECRRARISGAAAAVMLCYLVTLTVAILGAVFPPSMIGYSYGFGHALAGMDNLALPVAAIMLAQCLQVRHDRSALLRRVCQVTIGAMCANTAIAFASLKINLTPLLSHFWDSETTGDLSTSTVAGRAAQLGRITGIFNQPSEAGVMYSVALLMAIYLYRARPKRLAVVCVLLIAGGVLTVSKIFVLIAVPIAVWQIVRASGGRTRRIAWLGTAVAAAAVAGSAGIIPSWTGSTYLDRLIHPTDVLGLYSSGRLGSGSTLAPVIDAVIGTRPFSGIGAQGLAAAYDNAWVEGLVYAGIIGVAAYTAVMVLLARGWWTRRRVMLAGESRLVVGVLLVVAAASVGFPALTGNRVATILWLTLGLTALSPLARSPLTPSRASVIGHTSVNRGR